MIPLFAQHPKSLPVLFLTGMWERFGFYVVQGMLVLYLMEEFHFSDEASYTTFGVFISLVYMSPLIGGYLADKILGLRLAIIWGAIFLMIGYALFASKWENSVYLALATLVIGNGLYKPNIAALLGVMYESSEENKLETGFVIFYIALNLGIVLAGLFSGAIRNNFGWHAAFLLASFALLISLITFAVGIKLTHINYRSHESLLAPLPFLTAPWIIFYCFLSIPIISHLIQVELPAEWLISILALALVSSLVVLAFKHERGQRNNLFILSVLIVSSIMFWALTLQPFFSLSLFIHNVVDRDWFGIHIQTTAFYALISVYIILLAPLFAKLWRFFKYGKNLNSILFAFVLCMFALALGFFIITIGTVYFIKDYQVNPLWVVAGYFFFALAEVIFSAIGLSAILLLAPPKLVNWTMWLWFLSLGLGGVYAGWIAKESEIPDRMQSARAILGIYHQGFFDATGIAILVGIALLLTLGLIKTRNR